MTECIDHGRTRSLSPEGYALVKHPHNKSQCIRLHRIIYCAAHSITVAHLVGRVIRHTCDNPRCINPKHLLIGTRADNNRDRADRGRSAKYVRSRQRLTIEQVAAIKQRYDPTRVGNKAPNGVLQLSRDYVVDTNVIYKVIRGTYCDNDPNYRP
jgi:hypothetical protein